MFSKLLPTLRYALVCAISLLATASAAQTTIDVGPGQAYTTIQSGIDAAVNGDTVLVAPGTYYENINFKGKAITVTSSGGAASTIIDGNATPGLAVVGFGDNETRSSVLSNFTVRNGGPVTFNSAFTADAGGGIYIYNSSPTILNNIITGNACSGIESYYGTALIQGNVISGTSFAANAYCSFEPVAIVLYGNQTSTTLTNSVIGNTIENNTSEVGDFGAAIYIWVSNGNIIVGNTIRNNVSSLGAIQMYNSESIIFSQNLVYGNSTTKNVASSSGTGGLYLLIPDGSPPFYGIIANNTFANNTLSADVSNIGSQVYIDGDVSQFAFVNNILYGTGSSPLLVCNGIYAGLSPGPMLVENNDVFNPSGPTYDSSCANGAGMAGNIAVDPLFNNMANNDFHLQSRSPSIDVGNNQALVLLKPYGISLATDLDGNPRVQDATGKGCTIDMGVYEYPGTQSACSTAVTLTSSLNPSAFGQTVTFTAQLSSTSGVPTGDVQFTDGSTVLGTEAISSTGASTFSTRALAIGSHPITATYQPTGIFAAGSANLTQVVNGYPAVTTVTCYPSIIDLNATSQLFAAVTSPIGTPTGSITFTDNGAFLGSVALTTSATASLNYLGQVSGFHGIVAAYVPTGSFTASSAGCSVTVTALPSTSVLTVSPTSSTYGSPVTLTTTVSPTTPPGPSAPTGTVTFYNGATAIGSSTLVGGVANLTLSTLPAGNDNFTCTYSGSDTYAASSCNTVPATIAKEASLLTLTSSLNPAPALTPVTFTMQLTFNGQPAGAGITFTLGLLNSCSNSVLGLLATLTTDANGIATYTTSALPVGTDCLIAGYGGDANHVRWVANITEIIYPVSDPLTLAATPNPAYQGQTVTIAATFPAISSVFPAGPITFLDGSSILGTAALNASGQASFSTSTLSLGTHALTATYAAAGYFTAATSNTVQEAILPSAFTIALSPATITLAPGAAGTVAIQLASIGNFAGPLALSYGTPPTNATATISPTTVTLTAGGTGSSTLTLNTLLKASNTVPTKPGSRGLPVVFTAFTLLLVPFSFARRSKLTRVFGLVLLTFALQTITGCTNAWYTASIVAPGTYQLPVTATDVNHNSQTATLTVIVTQ